jgi:hypothetical protein
MKPHPSRTPSKLSESILHHLNMYALAANAAGVGILALAQPAEARIVYTSMHVRLQGDKPYGIDLNHDGKVDFFLLENGGSTSAQNNVFGYLDVCHLPHHQSGSTGPIICVSSTSAPNALNQVRVVTSGGAAPLRAGTKIQNNDRFGGKGLPVTMGDVAYKRSTSGTAWAGPWMDGGRGVRNRYLGLKFRIDGKFHFGWARVTVTTGKRTFTATLTGYAYETIAGKAIIAGDKGPDGKTVEPVSLGHLAAGASAIPAWRLRQTTATTQ